MEGSALLIIDVQNDYFSQGKMELPHAESAGKKIAKVLERFRQRTLPIIHIQHESLREGATFFLPGTEGMKIHECVEPLPEETVIVKHYPNSFLETDLLAYLQKNEIKRLYITGMMTFMCVDATTRAAKDLGFECVLLSDCTAAPPAEFAGVSCSAEQVWAVVTRALSFICDEVVSSGTFLDRH